MCNITGYNVPHNTLNHLGDDLLSQFTGLVQKIDLSNQSPADRLVAKE